MKSVSVAWVILAILIVAVSAISATKYFVFRDFLVVADVSCDPAAHSCFSSEDDTGTYYKKIAKPAHNIPQCAAWAGECQELSCAPGERQCSETYCDPEHDNNCYTESK